MAYRLHICNLIRSFITMTTKEAFEKITSEPRWYRQLGYTDSNGKVIDKRYRDGKLSIEKIEEVITKAGYTVKQEKTWRK